MEDSWGEGRKEGQSGRWKILGEWEGRKVGEEGVSLQWPEITTTNTHLEGIQHHKENKRSREQ